MSKENQEKKNRRKKLDFFVSRMRILNDEVYITAIWKDISIISFKVYNLSTYIFIVNHISINLEK